LTFFKLFSWNCSVYGFTGTFDEFCKKLDADANELLSVFDKIVQNYQLCPSTEIWSDYTIDRILGLLLYHYEMRHFDNEKFPLFLCEQLLDLIKMLHQWTDKGGKGLNNTPFKFYVSEIDMSNTFVLSKRSGKKRCSLKLFTTNHFDVLDQRFCKEAENWLNTAIQRSTLISGSSEKKRYEFFDRQRQKICALMEKMAILKF
jgi:hypothetical protein